MCDTLVGQFCCCCLLESWYKQKNTTTKTYTPLSLMGASNHFEIIQPLVQLNTPTHGCVRKNHFGQMEIHKADPGRGHCP